MPTNELVNDQKTYSNTITYLVLQLRSCHPIHSVYVWSIRPAVDLLTRTVSTLTVILDKPSTYGAHSRPLAF